MPILDYGGQQYDQSYEPSKDLSLSYTERMKLQMAKDEAITDARRTMSIDTAMGLVGGGYLDPEDVQTQQFRDAFDTITDAYENPQLLADMTDEQITQLQRLSSGTSSGNLYSIARVNDEIGAGKYFDSDFKDVVGGAGEEAIRRYNAGQGTDYEGIFSDDYAANPDNPDVPRVGAGGLADAIRGEMPQVEIGAPVSGRAPVYGSGGAPGDNQFGAPTGDRYNPYEGQFQRHTPNAGMDNETLYETQLYNLMGQSNELMEGQNYAKGIRAQIAAEEPAGMPEDPFSWYNPEGGGLKTAQTVQAGENGDPLAWGFAPGITAGMTNQAALGALGQDRLTAETQRHLQKAFKGPDGENVNFASGAHMDPSYYTSRNVGTDSGLHKRSLNEFANALYTQNQYTTPAGGGPSAAVGYAPVI